MQQQKMNDLMQLMLVLTRSMLLQNNVPLWEKQSLVAPQEEAWYSPAEKIESSVELTKDFYVLASSLSARIPRVGPIK